MALDPAAGQTLEEFYGPAWHRLVGTLRMMGVPAEDAVEVAQEAFIRLIPRWERVSGYDRPHAWLRTVAWRLWLNRCKRDRGLSAAPLPDLPAPGGSDTDLHRRLILQTALTGLGEGQREIVILHYLLDLPVAQIAQELGVAEGTVKSRLSRARTALAATLPEEVTDDA